MWASSQPSRGLASGPSRPKRLGPGTILAGIHAPQKSAGVAGTPVDSIEHAPGTRRPGLRRSAAQARPASRPQDSVAAKCWRNPVALSLAIPETLLAIADEVIH
jgi:hypothetical protein